MKNITKTFTSSIILILSIIIFIILRIPSLAEPHWYGDEGVYAGVAYAMENGKVLYTQVWDNKPPGIYFLYMMGNSENRLMVIRILNILAGVLSIAGIADVYKRQDNTERKRSSQEIAEGLRKSLKNYPDVYKRQL